MVYTHVLRDTLSLLTFVFTVASVRDCEQARGIVQSMPEQESGPCRKIKNLEFGLKVSDVFTFGTWDNIGATLDGPAGSATLAVAEAPSRGFQTWIPVNTKSAFGSDTININGIDRINLNAKGDFWKLFSSTTTSLRFKV